MGGKKSKPKAPPKTAKQLQREMKREIGKTIREFGREIRKLEFSNKKMNDKLKKLIKGKSSKAQQRITAQTIIRN